MDAFIFANRHGNELTPINEYYCPAMLPIGNKAVIDYTLEDLANNGIKNIKLIISNHLDTIESHIGHGAKWGLNISYFICQPQEGATTILQRLALKTDTPSLLIRGDILRSPCIKAYLKLSKQRPNEFVPAKMNNKNIGLLLLPIGKHKLDTMDFPLLFNTPPAFSKTTSQSIRPMTQILHGRCYMLDSFQSVMQANMDLANLKIAGLTPMGRKYTTSQSNYCIYHGAKTNIFSLDIQKVNAIIGQSTNIDYSVQLHGTSVIGHNCLIGHECYLKNCLIFPSTYVGEGLSVKNVILCRDLLITIKNNVCIRLNNSSLITHIEDISPRSKSTIPIQLSALLKFCRKFL